MFRAVSSEAISTHSIYKIVNPNPTQRKQDVFVKHYAPLRK